jgi:hypothetical protein
LSLYDKTIESIKAADLVIGIQIRVGDETFKNDRPNFDSYLPFFNCAEQIESSLAPNLNIRWLLISDSHIVRLEAKNRHKEKIIALPVGIIDHVMQENGGNHAKSSAAIATSISEQWIFSFCDFFVITYNSGFGRLAAARSMNFRSVYTFNVRDQPIKEQKCTINSGYASFADLSNLDAGFRRF